MEPTPSAVNQNGGDCTRVDRPGIKEPGAHECAPRTAAITHQRTQGLLADCGCCASILRPVKPVALFRDAGRLGLDLREAQDGQEDIPKVQKGPTA